MSTPPDPVPSLKAFAATTERLRQWRATHPTATLREIERETDRQLARVRADRVRADRVRADRAARTAARPDCPTCARGPGGGWECGSEP